MTKTNKSVVKPTSEKTVRSMYIDDAFRIAVENIKKTRKAAIIADMYFDMNVVNNAVVENAQPLGVAFGEAVAAIAYKRKFNATKLPWYKRTWNAVLNWFKK